MVPAVSCGFGCALAVVLAVSCGLGPRWLWCLRFHAGVCERWQWCQWFRGECVLVGWVKLVALLLVVLVGWL